jgi:vacuolar fusion protein MON1
MDRPDSVQKNSSSGATTNSPEMPTALRTSTSSSPNSNTIYGRSTSPEGPRPPLPPRPPRLDPETIVVNDDGISKHEPLSRPSLQSKATTALSLEDASAPTDARREKDGFVASVGRSLWGKDLRAKESLGQLRGQRGSETGDSVSIASYSLTAEEQEQESIFGDFIATDGEPEKSNTMRLGGILLSPMEAVDDGFVDEFESIGELDKDCRNEGECVQR